MTIRIPFNKPCVVGAEIVHLQEAIAGGHASGDGPFTKRAERFMEQEFGAHRVLLTTSCTAALEMAALLCDLGPGDEVIMPSYTFVSTANAVALRGATPVFVDVRPDTLNLDERLIARAITPRTKAIMPVHYAGIACEMDEIMEIASRHDLFVIEDAAQGVFARYKGRWLGTIGHLGCYSFHETKNFSCGEGGALVVNDPRLLKRAEILREKGTNRSQFLRGQSDKYTWVDLGSSYVLSDMLAAFLLGQLENMKPITDRRAALHAAYVAGFASLEQAGLVRLPHAPAHCDGNHHMFYLLAADVEERTALIAHLRERGILAVFHYVPLHSSPFARQIGLPDVRLPATDENSARLVRLPIYYDLSDEDQAAVIEAVRDFYSARMPG